jgi:hypothetical protein
MCNQGAHSPAAKQHQTHFGLKREYAMYLESDEESDNDSEEAHRKRARLLPFGDEDKENIHPSLLYAEM